MSNEQELEQEIQDLGLTAPRLTPADIDNMIESETFTLLKDARTTICQLKLINGFTVIGTNSHVSVSNHVTEMGERLSREKARDKVWELGGFLLHQKLYETRLAITALEEVNQVVEEMPARFPSVAVIQQLLNSVEVLTPDQLKGAFVKVADGYMAYAITIGQRMHNMLATHEDLQKRHDALAQSAITNFQLTSRINQVAGNEPSGDVRVWRKQAGLIRDEVVELLGNLHMDALYKFDFVKICMAFMGIWNYYDANSESDDVDPELVAAHQAAYDFVKLHNYQESIFTGPTDGVPTSSWPSVNPYAVRDDIQDILVTTYGQSYYMGFNADEDHQEVYRSNMTKFDTTAEAAALTQEKYEKLGIKTKIRVTRVLDSMKRDPGQESVTAAISEHHIVVVDGKQTGTDGKVYPDGKFLKSVNFEEPRYKPGVPKPNNRKFTMEEIETLAKTKEGRDEINARVLEHYDEVTEGNDTAYSLLKEIVMESALIKGHPLSREEMDAFNKTFDRAVEFVKSAEPAEDTNFAFTEHVAKVEDNTSSMEAFKEVFDRYPQPNEMLMIRAFGLKATTSVLKADVNERISNHIDKFVYKTDARYFVFGDSNQTVGEFLQLWGEVTSTAEHLQNWAKFVKENETPREGTIVTMEEPDPGQVSDGLLDGISLHAPTHPGYFEDLAKSKELYNAFKVGMGRVPTVAEYNQIKRFGVEKAVRLAGADKDAHLSGILSAEEISDLEHVFQTPLITVGEFHERWVDHELILSQIRDEDLDRIDRRVSEKDHPAEQDPGLWTGDSDLYPEG